MPPRQRRGDKTIELTTRLSVSSDLTIAADTTVELAEYGGFEVAAGAKLVILGRLRAPLRRVFYGAGSVIFGSLVREALPQWWGAKADGVTDDAAAIQGAIDAFQGIQALNGAELYGPVGGIVTLDGPYVVKSTLRIKHKSILLRGAPAWGGGQPETGFRERSCYLKWEGVAGIPMIKVDSYGCRLEDLWLLGNKDAKPSYGIELAYSQLPPSGTGGLVDNTCLRNVQVGPKTGYGAQGANQFAIGVGTSGDANNDTNHFERLYVEQCDVGVALDNPNGSICVFLTLQTASCGTGLRTDTNQVVVKNWNCALNSVADMQLGATYSGGDLYLENYVSDGGSQRMAIFGNSKPSRLVVVGGDFSVIPPSGGGLWSGYDSDYPPGGAWPNGRRMFIDCGESTPGAAGCAWIELRNFGLGLVNFTDDDPAPVLRAYSQSTANHVQLILDGCHDFGVRDVDLGPDPGAGSTDYKHLRFVHQPKVTPQAPEIGSWVFEPQRAEDRELLGPRHDFPGMVNVYGGPLKLKNIAAPTGAAATQEIGSGSTTWRYRVSAVVLGTGESPATSEVTCTNAASLGASNKNRVTWKPRVGASGYRVYGRAAGSIGLLVELKAFDLQDLAYTGWVDDGTASPGATYYDRDQTANLYSEGSLETYAYGQTLTADVNALLLGDGMTFRLDATGGSWAIRGIAGVLRARHIWLMNVGASNNITLANQHANATAAHRIITGTGADLALAPDASAHLWYDPTTARWRVIA